MGTYLRHRLTRNSVNGTVKESRQETEQGAADRIRQRIADFRAQTLFLPSHNPVPQPDAQPRYQVARQRQVTANLVLYLQDRKSVV